MRAEESLVNTELMDRRAYVQGQEVFLARVDAIHGSRALQRPPLSSVSIINQRTVTCTREVGEGNVALMAPWSTRFIPTLASMGSMAEVKVGERGYVNE